MSSSKFLYGKVSSVNAYDSPFKKNWSKVKYIDQRIEWRSVANHIQSTVL